MFNAADTEFNLDRHLISFLQDTPFFAELSRHIRKVPTFDIPTAGVAYDQQLDDLTLFWNPTFFGGGKVQHILVNKETGEVREEEETIAPLTDEEIRGVLLHEYYHLVFCHVSSRRKTPPKMWNVATDLAINSIIVQGAKEGNMRKTALPDMCLLPGVFPAPKGSKLTEEQKAAMPMSALIASLPHGQSSEWYYEKLAEKAEEMRQKGKGCPVHGKGEKGDGEKNKNEAEKNEGGKDHQPVGEHEHGGEDECTCGADPFGDLDSFDDHGSWDSIPEEMRELVEGKIKNIVEKAVKHADSQANGWGNMPAELRDAIRASVSHVVDWRSVLRQFVGGLARGERATTIKRINKRYPYIHPGVKRGYVAKLLIAIDMSGSVDNTQLALFFSELESLTKKVSVSVLPFDCTADERDIYEWRKGTKVEAKRVRGGGTDFNAPTQIANDPRNRGRWDGYLILTDGECNKPVASRVKRGWVVSPGHKLLFSTDEMAITLDPKPLKTGAWR
jgi:predicted metal-dependent peptidase